MPPKEPNIMDHLNAQWKDKTPEGEDADAILSEAVVSAHNKVKNQKSLPPEHRKLLTDALDKVKHEKIKELRPSIKTVQYFNQIGGAEHLVLHMALDEVADTVSSLDEFETLLRETTFLFWHVPTESSFERAKNRFK